MSDKDTDTFTAAEDTSIQTTQTDFSQIQKAHEIWMNKIKTQVNEAIQHRYQEFMLKNNNKPPTQKDWLIINELATKDYMQKREPGSFVLFFGANKDRPYFS